MLPVGGNGPQTRRGKEGRSGYNLYQQTVTADVHNKFGGADAFNNAVGSRFEPTTVGSSRLRVNNGGKRARERGRTHTERAGGGGGAKGPFATHHLNPMRVAKARKMVAAPICAVFHLFIPSP